MAFARTLGRWTGAPVAVVRLEVTRYAGLRSGTEVPAASLAGQRVVAASGIADPEAFIAQTKATGAAVQAATWRDHHDFRDEDVAWLAKAARRADHLVVTQKDAVKLRDRWPAGVPEPLVALLDLVWESGQDRVEQALQRLLVPRPPGPGRNPEPPLVP
jgi:tetraacyldisaccharide-1-P 4'-kinase